MKKKITALVLTGAVACGLVVPFSACKDKTNNLPEWDNNVTLTERGAEVSWEKVKGAEKYNVYYSASRFGTYTLENTQKGTKYTNPDKYGYYRVEAVDGENNVISSNLYSYDIDTFGANTRIYSPEDDQSAVQQDVDGFKDSTGQFSDLRYAGLFKAGEYNDLNLQMRYYMTFSGLGYYPTETELGGFFTKGELSGGNATCNFWCGIDNITVNSDVQWAVSQATSFRRMRVNGNLTLHDTGKTPWCSGGFISDTVVTGNIDGSCQQQWFTRNSDWQSWSGSDINMVFAGCSGKLKSTNWAVGNRVTYLDTTNVMREKPYLVFDNGYYVCRPALRKDYKGISWGKNADGQNGDEYIPLQKFYVARADRDTADTINSALNTGKNILFTPGIYNIDSPIYVKNYDTVIMGLGLATLRLTENNRDTIMQVEDVDDVQISGILFDAGPYSKNLLRLGSAKTGVRHENNPTVLNDVYYRIGGAGSAPTSVDVTLEINTADVVGDNFWVWRADHGNKGTVGWNVNKTKNGVVVNGDYVTVYGLMVEHFHEYQTIWNGEYGFTAFYQSETPYDVDMEYIEEPAPTEENPSAVKIKYTTQEKWMSEWNGVTYQGYASYKVSDTVRNHTAYGLGVYYVASGTRTFILDHGIEAPFNEGISMVHMAIANFSASGAREGLCGINHIINDRGEKLYISNGTKNHINSFISGKYTEK